MFNLLRYCARWAKFYRSHQPKKKGRSIRPLLECLEDRLVPSSFVVNTVQNSGHSLAWAINSSNSNPASNGPNLITFDLGGNDVILPTSPLPAITSPVDIDATTNPVTGMVILDGGNAGAGASGLVLDNDGCTIKGMTIISWKGDGIQINSSNNTIVGNSIGINFNQYSDPNGNGIVINNGINNTIGGITAADANTISFNRGDGIIIDGGFENGIVGNFIGTNRQGNGYMGNGYDGIHILGNGAQNGIGEVVSGIAYGNVISGNTGGAGIEISGSKAIETYVVGNKIGTDAAGKAAYANEIGVKLDQGTNGNIIGGGDAADANVISGNNDQGVLITDFDTTNNTIEGDQIGTQFGGEAKLGNGGAGVYIDSAYSNFVISSVISANTGDGVDIVGGYDNQIQANMIGTDLNGSKALANSGNGVNINGLGTNGNVIGGVSASLANTISGNAENGIAISQQASDNTVLGNFIGVNAADSKALPNHEDGVDIYFAATGNYIGSTQPKMAAGNVIAGNVGNGVEIDMNSPSNYVLSNQIGTDQSGSLKLPNQQNGVAIYAATGNVVGSSIGGNLISANKLDGILIQNYAYDNTAQGNKIGTNLEGSAAMPNGQNGVEIALSSTDTTIGGSTPGDGNLISGNGNDGILIDEQSDGNFVQGNTIGLNEVFVGLLELSTAKLPNGRDGVEIETQSDSNTIGGTALYDGNVISGNAHVGVNLITGATANILENNYIGTTADSATGLGNEDGVFVDGATGNFIGDLATGHDGQHFGVGNVISGNLEDGVIIEGAGTTSNTVEANDIGVNWGGTAVVANGNNGVAIAEGAADNTVGGIVPAAGNVISGNVNDGVELKGTGTDGNKIESNIIGVSSNLSTPLPNVNGIDIRGGASKNTVGGGVTLANLIAGNSHDGVVVVANDSTGNLISQNSIYNNGAIGIDLGNHGTTLANGTGGPLTGPNDLQQYPVLSPGASPGTISGTLSSADGQTYTIEFFASATSTPGQGELYLNSISVTTGVGGLAAFTFSNFTPNPQLPYITATATSSSHNTSEFSAPVQVSPSGSGTNLTATAGAALTGVFAMFNAGFLLPAVDITATINWGDVGVANTNLPPDTSMGPVMAAGSGFEVTGTHTYGQPGMYNVTVTITGPDGISMTVMSTVDVLANGATETGTAKSLSPTLG